MIKMAKVYFNNFCKQIYARLEELIAVGALEGKKIVLFGLNSSSYVVRDYLQEKYKILAYIDNNKEKRAQSEEKIPAYSPEELAELFDKDVAILITSKYYAEMKKQLEELGYEEDVQFFRIIDVHNLEQYVDFSDVTDMREISKEELKQVQMRLLRMTKQICEEHQLRFYLTGGTLLGAIRHKGYIPWDDDIDIVMPMKDYRKFMDIVNEGSEYQVLNAYDHPEQFHSYYSRLVCPGTNIKTWDYPYIESLGINIDIFPLYGVPEETEEAERFADEMEKLHVKFIEEFIKYPEPTARYYELQKEILAMMDRYTFDESTNIAYLLSRHKKKEIMPAKIYDRAIMAEFEGELFPIPEGYDEYLTRLFGAAYMELPPEKDRYSVHNYKAFVADTK